MGPVFVHQLRVFALSFDIDDQAFVLFDLNWPGKNWLVGFAPHDVELMRSNRDDQFLYGDEVIVHLIGMADKKLGRGPVEKHHRIPGNGHDLDLLDLRLKAVIVDADGVLAFGQGNCAAAMPHRQPVNKNIGFFGKHADINLPMLFRTSSGLFRAFSFLPDAKSSTHDEKYHGGKNVAELAFHTSLLLQAYPGRAWRNPRASPDGWMAIL